MRDPNERSWSQMFDWFWGIYPRKVGKPIAERSWGRIKPQDQNTVDAIDQGLERWEKYWADQETEREFIPHPSTWLNQRRWEDQP